MGEEALSVRVEANQLLLTALLKMVLLSSPELGPMMQDALRGLSGDPRRDMIRPEAVELAQKLLQRLISPARAAN